MIPGDIPHPHTVWTDFIVLTAWLGNGRLIDTGEAFLWCRAQCHTIPHSSGAQLASYTIVTSLSHLLGK